MLSSNFKAPVTRVITPIARALLALHITPNIVTVVGALGSVCASVILVAHGHFLAGVLINVLLMLSDLLDGTMARLINGGTKWGAVLDSTLDRIADSALILSLAYFLHLHNDRLLPLVLSALIGGLLVPYIRARAESLGIECSVGIAERTERLIMVLVGIGLEGLGVDFALAISMWILAILSWITVFQRLNVVRISS